MKVKKLEFDPVKPEDRDRFYLLYQGFVLGGTVVPQGEPRGMVVTRREAKIMDKLEGISQPEMELVDGQTRDTGGRILTGNLITLEQPEFELVVKYFERAPWTPRAARKVVDISDWLSSLPLVEETNGG